MTTASSVERGSYTIRRSYGQPPVLTSADNRPVTGVDLDRGSFLPLDSYSSLEIEGIAQESLGEKRRALLDELCLAEMQAIQLGLADQRRKLEANADSIKAAQRRIADLTEQIEELGDVPGKLAALPQVTESTASPEFQAASQQQAANEQEKANLRAASEAVAQLRSALPATLTAAKRTFPAPASIPGSKNLPIMERVDRIASDLWKTVAKALATAYKALADAEAELTRVQTPLDEAHATHDASYAVLQQQNQAAVRALETRNAAQREAIALEKLKKDRAESETELKALHTLRAELKGEFLLTRDKISDLRENVAAGLQRESGKKVIIRVHRNADSSEYKNQLLAALQGSGTKNPDEIVSTLAKMPPEQLAQVIRENDVEELDAQSAFGPERTRRILASLREKTDPLTLEILPIDDRIAIELNVGDELHPNFRDAAELSRGQKCTALLPILLARRESPLVIDQPEDNLDNHFIYETVVESIRRLKPRRQMVFITHNANIPVLGEAELVIVMNSDGKRAFVEKAGTVDECRKEIIDLLGGSGRGSVSASTQTICQLKMRQSYTRNCERRWLLI